MKRVKKIWLIGIWTLISVFSYHSFDTSENYLRSEDSHTKKASKALFEIKQKNKDAADASLFRDKKVKTVDEKVILKPAQPVFYQSAE